MASLPSPTTPLPLPPQAQEEERSMDGVAPSLPQDYDDFISKLPREDGWAPFIERHYQGFMIPQVILPGLLAMQQHFKARPGDIFLASFPKAGTTWSKALTFAIMTRTQHPLARHPLLSLTPHDCVGTMEELFTAGQASKLEALPSPRLISTHMPYSLLPDSITGTDHHQCRIVHVAREPKDLLVSLWHFGNKFKPEAEEPPTPLVKALELFCEGRSGYGPIWDHVLEYWRESQRRPEKVLFLKYEEMLEDPVRNVKKLAEFMGFPFSIEEEREGVVEEVIRLCSFEQLSRSADINKGSSTGQRDYSSLSSTSVKVPPYAAYFRKGRAGDWRNHLSPEMARRLDDIMEEKLRGSGLSFGRTASEEAAFAHGSLGS